MGKIILEKVIRNLKLIKVVVISTIGGHGYHLTKLFSGHKPCYEGQ